MFPHAEMCLLLERTGTSQDGKVSKNELHTHTHTHTQTQAHTHTLTYSLTDSRIRMYIIHTNTLSLVELGTGVKE